MAKSLVVARNLTRERVIATHVEIAGSLWRKFMGLMGRRTLAPGGGLWLPGSNGIHMMFMRFPIDAVFVGRADDEGLRRVVSVHRRLPPWSGVVPLVRGAHGVLELPAGTVDATGLDLGDQIGFEAAPAS
jgi:uncharacterized protein